MPVRPRRRAPGKGRAATVRIPPLSVPDVRPGWLAVLRGPLAPILAVSFLVNAGMGMAWSVLAVYAASLGASPVLVGVVIASFGVSRLFVNVPAGQLSERLGRGPVVVGGLLILAVGSMGAISPGSVWVLVVALAVQAVGAAAVTTASMAAIVDLGNPDTRVRDMAAFQTATMMGVSIGPGIGGLLAAASGFGGPFIAQAAFGVLSAVVLWRLLPARPVAAATPKVDRRVADLLGPLARPAAMMYAIVFLRMSCSWVLLPLIMTETLGLGVGTVGLVLTCGTIANAVVLPATPWIARKLGRVPLVALSSAVGLAGLAPLAAEPSLAWATCSAVFLGLSSGLGTPPVTAGAADAAPPDRIGATMGLLRMMNDIAFITGPILTGVFVDQLGVGYIGGLYVCGFVLLAMTGFYCMPRRGMGK